METLSNYQRLNLINQYEILHNFAIIRGDNCLAKKYAQYIEILQEGYISEYYMLFEDISDEFSKEESNLVWDILQIYSIIQNSYKKIKAPKLPESQIRFAGFDGNYETSYLAFCRFILFDLNRFGELTKDVGDNFNSHYICCDKYKEMQRKWNAMGRPFELSENDIENLLSK